MESNAIAEDKLLVDMKVIATYLESYVHQTKQLPEEASEIEKFCQSASALLAEDPYNPKAESPKPDNSNPDNGRLPQPLPRESDFEAGDCDLPANSRVEMKLDYSLSDESVAAMKEQLPASWKAEPGKICLVTNGMSWAVIWGAGSSQMPIRSHETGKPLVITLKVR